MNEPVWANANIWESVAVALPEEPAIIQGEQVIYWRTFDTRANSLAAHFLAAGLKHQSKVGMVPFNINYHYGVEEIGYLLDNSDAEAVVFEANYTAIIEAMRDRLPMMKSWIGIAREGAGAPEWAVDYDEIPDREVRVMAPWGRNGNDLLFIYTGDTTGMPKGVKWRQGDLLAKAGYGANSLTGLPPLEDPEQAGPRAKWLPLRPRSRIAPPLMHGTGMLSAFGALTGGGSVILLPRGHFSGELLWDIAAQHKATRVTIVGQPFAQPMWEALEANPGQWNLSSIFVIGSLGAMWSRGNKQGRVAVGGYIPVGYYKDEAKSASTFIEFEGRAWSMPGDWAEVNDDGALTLLGRGSQCINSGGEKIFPEEVEEVLKCHDAVRDAAVSGIPDDRFGEGIAALVELHVGSSANEAEPVEHVKSVLVDYKAPRHVLVVKTIPRARNGKMDYKSVKEQAVTVFASEAAA